MASKYLSYAELARREALGRDYRVRVSEVRGARLLVAAPHGGMIEQGTSEIACLIAGREYSLFIFEGIKPYGSNRDLHITSHQFDHPDCLAMAARCESVLGVHGCVGEARIHVGGLDAELKTRLAMRLTDAGFAVDADSERYPGRHRHNICNRGSRAMGAQLEITHDLRIGAALEIASAVRAALPSPHEARSAAAG
ncbi:MAG TPA: poly-gamma-glutamate hydrolase family protein [Steroidobacteraceae bacterium]|nr:poly-gamma-glutamate hydrolase family protein [Steroidobacteraceae bacterium]